MNLQTDCRNVIAQDHILSCIKPALKQDQHHVIADVEKIIRQMMRTPQGSHH